MKTSHELIRDYQNQVLSRTLTKLPQEIKADVGFALSQAMGELDKEGHLDDAFDLLEAGSVLRDLHHFAQRRGRFYQTFRNLVP